MAAFFTGLDRMAEQRLVPHCALALSQKVNRLRPYLAIGGGLVTSVLNPGFDPARVTNGALELLGGLDIRMTDSVDIRAVEWGAAAGYSSTGVASEVGFLDAGVVYSLPAQHQAELADDLGQRFFRLIPLRLTVHLILPAKSRYR